MTAALTKCCQDLFRVISTNSAWGISALQTMSGINFDDLDADERQRMLTLPAMIFYGVPTVEAVPMRTLSAPRSIAESLGTEFEEQDNVGPQPNCDSSSGLAGVTHGR